MGREKRKESVRERGKKGESEGEAYKNERGGPRAPF
jgi:hypothetical protein